MCDCNESPFTKLRESWSRHYQDEMRGQCNCCCQNQNGHAKVKGKFGVAYVIETPTRKCKPCGWEIEFNDTPSQIENNCKKMMTWITCPPLGECQNNHTNFCCGSTAPKEVLNAAHMCYKSGDLNSCSCSKDKSRTSGGDCCFKNTQPICNCAKKVNQKQHCSNCRAMNGQQAYLKSKNKCTCCSLRSNESPRCCCSIRNDEDECCPCKNKTNPKCCCESDSQSSLEDSSVCDCQKIVNRKTKKGCDCQCNCANCKCSGSTKMPAKHREYKNANKTKGNNRTSSQKMDSKQSKNLHSSESRKERQKGIQRSPYTMSASLPKKGPDKENFFEELNGQKTETNKTKTTDIEKIQNKNEDNSKVLQQVETEIRNMDYENEKLKKNQSKIEKYETGDDQNKGI